MTPRIGVALAKMMGHHDDGYSMRSAPEDVQAYVKERVLRFGHRELAKVFCWIYDNGFGRPSNGYSFIPTVIEFDSLFGIPYGLLM